MSYNAKSKRVIFRFFARGLLAQHRLLLRSVAVPRCTASHYRCALILIWISTGHISKIIGREGIILSAPMCPVMRCKLSRPGVGMTGH